MGCRNREICGKVECLGGKIRLLSAGHFQLDPMQAERGEALKTRTQLILIFAAGLGLGALSHAGLTAPTKNSTDQSWMNAYNEEKVQKIMLQFQKKLDELEKAGTTKDAAELSKQVELQSGILDLISKYREGEFAKYAPFSSIAGVALSALLGFLASKLVGKQGSETKPNP